jgi:hypothetical protein
MGRFQPEILIFLNSIVTFSVRKVRVMLKVKLTLEQAMKVHRGSKGGKKLHSLKVVFKGIPEWSTSDKTGIPKASVIHRYYVTAGIRTMRRLSCIHYTLSHTENAVKSYCL